MTMVEGLSQPALQVIVLGSGGGPLENNTTSILVRSTATRWSKGSVLGVDAGVHLAAIVRILESHSSNYSPDETQRPVTLIDGPFAGLEIPHSSAKANAAFVTNTLIETCLITHPHLDHISGFVVNTAGLPGTRPKRLAGLPSTIEAFKDHIFNNIIWPNLSDENNGAGLVTYMRLVEGGSPALGEGEGKGYVEICEGLSVKTWSVSHGHCMENHSHRGSMAGPDHLSSRPEPSPRMSGSQLHVSPPRSVSVSSFVPNELLRSDSQKQMCVYHSSAYFIRDIATGKEVLIFGDVEPDSISLWPRNKLVWNEAAPKIVANRLGGIFIECSFDDSISTDRLYGHLAPRFLMEELRVLAAEVENHREANSRETDRKKRKRLSNGHQLEERNPRRVTRASATPISPLPPRSVEIEVSHAHGSASSQYAEPLEILVDDETVPIRTKNDSPLDGLKIFIIHVKERLTDGPEVGDIIMKELQAYEEEAQLGCTFILTKTSQSVYL